MAFPSFFLPSAAAKLKTSTGFPPPTEVSGIFSTPGHVLPSAYSMADFSSSGPLFQQSKPGTHRLPPTQIPPEQTVI